MAGPNETRGELQRSTKEGQTTTVVLDLMRQSVWLHSTIIVIETEG